MWLEEEDDENKTKKKKKRQVRMKVNKYCPLEEH